jgi:hypothetical protein
MNNPPAFPIANLWHNELKEYNGMTLRDYFAAKAMQGFCTNRSSILYVDASEEAYRMADAMLKARES